MPKQDDFSMLDSYATILAGVGGIVLVASLCFLVFALSAGLFWVAVAALATLPGSVAFFAAAKLLRCVLVIHRDTRVLLDRTMAGPAPAPAAE